MEMQTTTPPINYERLIAAIVRKLPPERRAQILAFARFIAYETFKPKNWTPGEDDAWLTDEYTENDARWEALLTSEVGQNVLDKLVDEALTDIRAGKAKPIAFIPEGELAPG